MLLKRHSLVAVMSLAISGVAHAQLDPRLSGDWNGVLAVGGARLRIVFHIQLDHGTATATLDSPDQHKSGIAVASVKQDGGFVVIDIPAVQAKYSGRLIESESRIEGRLTQRGNEFPLVLSSGMASVEFRRPQEPRRPWPYRSEEVSFVSSPSEVRLAGTLTLPQGTGPFAAVVLIKGSGPLDRDETIFGHKPFWVLADALTRRGVAVLRVDGRGVGGSDRGPSTATSADFADDVAAGVDLLRRRPDIRPDLVGLIGHSEGAVIAPMVAAKDDRIAFLVLMAGLGIRGEDNTLAQMRAIRTAEGAAPDQIDKQQAMMAQVLSVVASAANEAAAQPEVLKLFADGGIPEQQAEKLALRWNNRWERFILPYRPDITLGKIHCPVLALNGSKDLQVPANLNLPAIKSALSKDSDVTVEELPGLNHLFQTADKGLPSEYGRIEETISPTALRLVTEWVVSHSR